MKKTSLLLLVCLALAVTVKAQEFKKFKVGVGAGYASPSGDGAKGGVLFTLEPAYRVQDNIQVGLRMEWAVIARGVVQANSTSSSFDVDVKAIGSYTVNGQYYFSNNNFRPFVGVGTGLYKLAAVAVSGNSNGNNSADVNIAAASKLGFYPRVGFDAKHFTLSIDYNIVPASKSGNTEVKNSYLGVRLGAFFGGGRKS